ncbi:MAG: hypothetical protein PWQ59_1474 [Thermoanaerobacterium sp.]|jgi:hypothetical protein|nr:hypothetical protein [Thermoanaerobacterium sp.]MDK2905061.1 hypothetical protein [Eubacteriaceae bacterium]MDN5300969.1 hypothetical protein [Thermoanaerobacteraceae bacterium]
MNKIGFTFSGILVIIGVITLLITKIINLVMPKIGRVAFQAAMAGSYNPSEYYINFFGVNAIAICLIIIGIVFGYKLYKSETK